MKKGRVSILYITHNRLGFSRTTLPHLLESGGHEDYSVSIVDNASTDGTREWLMSLSHSRIKNIVLNDENLPLREVTNSFWASSADAEFIGKVDNDTVMPVGFFGQAARVLRNPVKLGAVGAMHFQPIDVMSTSTSRYAHNIRRLPNGGQVVLQRHLGGCCYLMRYSLLAQFGFMDPASYMKGGWTEYQWRVLKAGYPSAYLYPFMFAKHLDDPDFALSVSQMGSSLPSKLPPVEKFRESEKKSVANLLSAVLPASLLPRYKV